MGINPHPEQTPPVEIKYQETQVPQDLARATCPICRGKVWIINETSRTLAEHVDQTGLRCEGSFTRLDQDHE